MGYKGSWARRLSVPIQKWDDNYDLIFSSKKETSQKKGDPRLNEDPPTPFTNLAEKQGLKSQS